MVKLLPIDIECTPGGTTAEALSVLELLNGIATPTGLKRKFDVERTESGIQVKGTTLTLAGNSVTAHLKNCNSLYIMCATLGFAVDNKINAYRSASMSKSFMLDNFSNILIEKFCEQITSEISELECGKITPRFSCGYGDLDLKIQGDLLQCLDAEKRLGIKLTDANIMQPQKTVTAIIGVGEDCVKGYSDRCAFCARKNFCNGEKCFD